MEARVALWTLIGTLVFFKVATTVIIYFAAPEGAAATIGLFIAFHWPFMLAGVIFAAAPALFWLRLVRVRAKRAQLEAAEWSTD